MCRRCVAFKYDLAVSVTMSYGYVNNFENIMCVCVCVYIYIYIYTYIHTRKITNIKYVEGVLLSNMTWRFPLQCHTVM